MSLQIPCEHCGLRPVEEFVYGEIPQVPDDLEDPIERDLIRGFFFHNTEGVQKEAWYHTYGCRRWTYLERDTVRDQVVD